MKKTIMISLLAPLALTGCVSKIDVHGKYITEEQVKQIKISEHNKSDVEEMLGSPSGEAPFDAKTWYYLGQKTSKTSFFKPKLIDFKGYEIHFTEEGYVEKVNLVNAEDLTSISPARRYTPTAGHQMSFWEQMGSYVKRGAPGKKK